MPRRFPIIAVMLLIGVSIIAAPVTAATDTPTEDDEDDDDEGDTIINIDIDAVVDVINDLIDEVESLAGDLGNIIVQAGLTLLVKPFQEIARTLSDVFTHAIVAYPDVKHSDVLDIHGLVFHLSLLFAVPVFIWIGFQHLTGRADGIRSTAELVGVLVAGGFSPWLLHYPVELSRLASVALRPEDVSIMASLSVSLTTAVIIWLKAIVLIALVILFVVRSFFLLWYVAAAPLIFLLTYFRPTRKVVSPLTGLFVGFLLVGPLDLIAYQLVLALLDMRGGSPVPQFIWGLGGYFVMLALPYQILSSSSSLVLPAMIFARDAAGKVGDRVKPVVRERYADWKENGVQRVGRATNRFMQDSPAQVQLKHQSKNEVELQDDTSRLRQVGNRVKSRVRNDEPEVTVEENWQQDEYGDWSTEAELNRGDD